MNQEVVKKLAEKAGFTAGVERYATPDYQTVERELIEKFARLLVRECATVYDMIDNGNKHLGTRDYPTALLRHFELEHFRVGK
jgi:hypothetical protein